MGFTITTYNPLHTLCRPRNTIMATEEPTRASPVGEEVDSTTPKKRKADLEELEVNLEAPEPPSKRAKRALKKGKPLPPKADSDDEKKSKKKRAADDATAGAATDDADEQAKPAPTRSEHSVWIGNLPFNVTINELRAWLVDKSGGAVANDAITRVNMPTQKMQGKKDKTNKGFAYVDFADLGAKVAAVALSEEWLGIRKLLIKDSKSYEGRPKKEERAATAAALAEQNGTADEPVSRKIFVGNLGFQVTEDDVRANFDKCGEIDWVKLATFEDSGKCKGYGWVKFREAESAGQAVKGFVKIKEELETEDDFVEAKKDEDSEDEEKKDDKATEKKFKTRKWWINRIAGRQIKIELAEDDQTRYKKRFRGQKKGAAAANGQGEQADGEAETEKPHRKPAPPRELKAQDDLMVARLTGAAAKPTGTKITF